MKRSPDHYYGAVVDGYDTRRQTDRTWHVEQAVVKRFLENLPKGSTCIDVPVGTGRFLEYYAANDHVITAVDLSSDMLNRAAERASTIDLSLTLCRGDIFGLPFREAAFDAVVCFRLLTWFDKEQIHAALGELARISQRRLLISAHVWDRPQQPRDLLTIARRYTKQNVTHRDSVQVRRHSMRNVRRIFSHWGLKTEAEHTLQQKGGGRYVAWLLHKI